MRDVDFLLFQSREWIADNRNSSAISFFYARQCMRLGGCLRLCALLLCMSVSRYAYSRCMENITLKQSKAESHHIISHWTLGTTFAVILFEQRQSLFIWRCHFRRSSFSTKTELINSSRRHKRHTDVCNRPPIPIVWLKLAIKIFRQNKCIQTKIKEKNYTFKSLMSMCWILNVGSVY